MKQDRIKHLTRMIEHAQAMFLICEKGGFKEASAYYKEQMNRLYSERADVSTRALQNEN